MKNRLRKQLSYLLVLVMVCSMIPSVSVFAGVEQGTVQLKFNQSDMSKAVVTCQVGDAAAQSVNDMTSDEGGAIWITNIANNSSIKITATAKDDNEIAGINVLEGEAQDAAPAYNGRCEEQEGSYVYTFVATTSGDENSRVYVVSLVNNENPGGPGPGPEGPEGPEGPGPGGSFWADQYLDYMKNGIGLISRWIGSSEGSLSYSFSSDDEFTQFSPDIPFGEATVLDRETVEGCLATLGDDSADADAKKQAKDTLFGIQPTGAYMKILAGQDLAGDHLGFEVYYKDEQGRFIRKDDLQQEITYYNYSDGCWQSFTESEDHRWEGWLKGGDYFDGENWKQADGLIINFGDIDPEQYIIRGVFPFDSRKNLSWWNTKYKGEVEAAGDRVSDDSWVENGSVELVKVTNLEGTEVYYSNDPDWEPSGEIDENLVVNISRAGYDMGELRPGYDGPKGQYSAEEMLEAANYASGQCNVPNHSRVTVLLTPDPGYQILKVEINGMTLTPDEGTQSMFSFEINSNIHFLSLFEKTPDVINVEGSNDVTKAMLDGSSEAIDSGNLALTVEDKLCNEEEVSKVVEGTPVATVDMVVDQIVAKAGNLSSEEQEKAREGSLEITDDTYWKTNVKELNNPVEISLTLDDITIEPNQTLSLVREHEGSYEEIPVEVTTENGDVVATFESDKFSAYTFVKTNKVFEEHEHSFVSKVNKELEGQCVTKETCYREGVYKKYCEICYELSSETFQVEKTPHCYKTRIEKATTSKDGAVIVACVNEGCTSVKSKTKISKIASIKLAKTSYPYTGKAIKPTVTVLDATGKTIDAKYYSVAYSNNKAMGTATAKITFKDRYSCSKELRYTIKPKTEAITKIVGGDKTVALTWAKGATGTTGYEVYRATSKNGTYRKVTTIKKVGTVSYTDKKLSQGKTYYYKVRAYATVGGTNIYGTFSPVKSVATYTATECFVARIYTKALGREADAAGLKYWAGQIDTKKMTPVQVAENFFFSKEFTNKKLNNAEYVKVLYRTFMGREADKGGLDYWVGQLNAGKSRKDVMKSFAGCAEFKNIVKNFGL